MMRIRFLIGLFLAVLLLGACNPQPKEIKEEIIIEKEIDGDAEPGVVHVVHFWLDTSLSEQDREAFERGVLALEAIPSVKRLWIGKPAATPNREVVDNSFDYSLTVWFDDVAGHDVYQAHPIHTKFVEQHESKFSRVRVRDSAY